MKRGMFLPVVLVFFAAVAVPAKGADVEVGNLRITGEIGTDGLTFPDNTTQMSAVTTYQRPVSSCSTGQVIGGITLEGGVTCYSVPVSGACADGQVPAYTTGGWGCADVAYTNGAGISLTGNEFSITLPMDLSSASSGTATIKGTNTGGAWGAAVMGVASGTGDIGNYGGQFSSSGNFGTAVIGFADAEGATVQNSGGYFNAKGDLGYGVMGNASAANGTNYGGHFQANGATGIGVYGIAAGTTGVNYGVYGETASPIGYAGYFQGNVTATGTITGNGSGLTNINPASHAHPGMGTVTSVSAVAGSGITVSNGTTDAQLNTDTNAILQKRISSSCGTGFMTGAQASGTPTCTNLTTKIMRASCSNVIGCSCPAGTVATGGGARCANTSYFLYQSYSDSASTWRAVCSNGAATANPAEITVICATP